MKAGEVLAAMAAARRHTRVRGSRRRIVVRFGVVDLAEIDALRRSFPSASRASLIRTLTMIGIETVKGALAAQPTPEAAP